MGNEKQTVVLIHGLWLTSLSWENWVERYRSKGFEVVVKSWPGMDVGIDDLRRDSSGIEHLGLGEIVDHYEEIIGSLDRPPIIIGHSFGGLITQILLDHGLGAAGVAIDSVPAKGIFRLPLSTLRSSFPVMKNPANRHRAVALTAAEFRYAFTNTMGDDESRNVYERYAVPGPGRVIFQAALANFNTHAPSEVHFDNDQRAPLLIVAGGEDHVSPPSINEATARLQRKSRAITAFKLFPNRPHFILGEKGWEEVADYALEWAMNPQPS